MEKDENIKSLIYENIELVTSNIRLRSEISVLKQKVKVLEYMLK